MKRAGCLQQPAPVTTTFLRNVALSGANSTVNSKVSKPYPAFPLTAGGQESKVSCVQGSAAKRRRAIVSPLQRIRRRGQATARQSRQRPVGRGPGSSRLRQDPKVDAGKEVGRATERRREIARLAWARGTKGT